MNTWEERIGQVVYRIFFIGISLQIIVGIGWMLANFNNVQEFGESDTLIEISSSFLYDEYVGILYPIIIWLVKGIEKVTSIPYFMVLYFLQLIMGWYAGSCLLQTFSKNISSFWKIWGTFGLLTIPIVMQCHLAVLQYSFTLSFFLLLFSNIWEAMKQLQAKQLETKQLQTVDVKFYFKILALYFIVVLFSPEYRYLAGIPVLFFLFYYIHCGRKALYKNKKLLMYSVFTAVVIFLALTMISGLIQKPGNRERMENTLAACMVSRFAWPWYLEHYSIFPEEIREIMSIEEIRQVSWYADEVVDVMGPMIEEAVGIEKAQDLYWQMAAIGWKNHTKQIIKEILEDAVSYTIAPVMLQRSLEGKGNTSYSGRNYEIMKEHTPGFTAFYVRYGNWWFAVGILLEIGIFFWWFIKSWKNWKMWKNKSIRNKKVILLTVTSVAMVGFYTMTGAGKMDYKDTLFITILWFLGMICSVENIKEKIIWNG